MNDVERLAEALRRADAELDLASPDLAEALEHARRRLITRLLLVGVLSALGAMLLLTGGIKAGATIRGMRDNGNDKTESAKKRVHSGHHQHKHKGGNHGGHGGTRGGGKENNRKAGGKHKPPHHPKHEPSGSGGTEAEGAPDLVVVALSSTEVTVKNIGETEAIPFSVAIWVVESESELESTRVAVEVPFDRLPALEGASAEVIGLECSAGQEIYAEVDYLDAVEEARDENNRSKPIACEPPEENEDGKRETQKEAARATQSPGSVNLPPNGAPSPAATG